MEITSHVWPKSSIVDRQYAEEFLVGVGWMAYEHAAVVVSKSVFLFSPPMTTSSKVVGVVRKSPFCRRYEDAIFSN